MPKYYTSIDTFHLSFKSIEPINYTSISSNVYKIIPTSTKKDYNLSFHIYTTINNQLIRFADLNHSYRYNPSSSQLHLYNDALYCHNWSNILNQIVYDFSLDVSISKMEIAIDTNINILKKLHTLYMNTDKIIIKDKRYDFDCYGKMKHLKSQGYKDFYNNSATQYLSNEKTSTTSQIDRLENKTVEITDSSYKYYIIDYLSTKIDTTKIIFRFEKTLFSEDLGYSNKVYLNTTTGEVLSKHHYTNLNPALQYSYKQYDEYSKMDIDFSKLEDPQYLTSVFNHYSLFNHEIILDTYKKTPHFRPKYVKHFSIVKPSTRSITIAKSKHNISQIKAEFERINNLYKLDEVNSIEDINKKELEILFDTPIPPVYITDRGNKNEFPGFDDWIR